MSEEVVLQALQEILDVSFPTKDEFLHRLLHHVHTLISLFVLQVENNYPICLVDSVGRNRQVLYCSPQNNAFLS